MAQNNGKKINKKTLFISKEKSTTLKQPINLKDNKIIIKNNIMMLKNNKIYKKKSNKEKNQLIHHLMVKSLENFILH